MEHFNPRSVEEVFKEFKGRRTALLTALTTDFDEVYRRCDIPGRNGKLFLMGHPGEEWEVNFAGRGMHGELPQPHSGINFGRERMEKREWLTMLAIHSDIWLLAVAFSFSSSLGHDKADRTRLFNMINELPTILEVVSGKAVEPPKHNPKLLNDDTQQPKRKWSTPQPRNWKDEAIVRGKSLSGPAAPAMASSARVSTSKSQARLFPVQFEDPSTLLASHRQIAASLQATITGLENLLGTHLNEIARLEGMARILANKRTSDYHDDASTDSD